MGLWARGVVQVVVLCCLVGHTTALFPGRAPDDGDVRHLYEPISVAIGLDTHAHVLPFVLGWIENVEYPKSRIRLEIYLNNKEDTTSDQVSWWKSSVKDLFQSLDVYKTEANWLEAALRSARIRQSKRVLLLSGDTLPTNALLLKILSKNTETAVIPLFDSSRDLGVQNIEVQDDEATKDLLKFKTELIALPLFINLDVIDSSYLTFDADNLPNYDGDVEPLEVFTVSAQRMSIDVWIDRQTSYGIYINSNLDADDRRRQFRYYLADRLADDKSLPMVSRSVRPYTPEPQLWSVDKVYMINLKRRPERLRRMERIFDVLGVDSTYWEATDGQSLPSEYPVTLLKSYEDPFHKRPMKAGEVGCFLSHYRIWEDVVRLQLDRVIVFEDDLRFSLDGLERIKEVIEDLDASQKPWDLIYLGRKKQDTDKDMWVQHHRHLSTVGYSYWTLGYLLSQSGARKLLEAKPLERLVPVDEYLPIMFDRHPNTTWSSAFPRRDLLAFTLFPLAVYPQCYTHEDCHVTDTEDSALFKSRDSSVKDEL